MKKIYAGDLVIYCYFSPINDFGIIVSVNDSYVKIKWSIRKLTRNIRIYHFYQLINEKCYTII